jgi:hypothetical protein
MRLFLVGVFVALVTASCSAVPPPLTGPEPADPHAPVAAAGYRPALVPYTSRRPVEPTSWQQQNERVTPTPKQ